MDRKEAIEVVRKKVDYYEADKRLKAALEALIPELAESEDEKNWEEEYTLQRIIEQLEDEGCPQSWKDLLYDTYNLPYEKQKERGPLTKEEEYTLNRIIEYLEDESCPLEWRDLLGDIHNLPYTQQKEQKPAEWSEEDEAFLKVAIAICNRYSHKDIADWLKSLRPQPKQDIQPSLGEKEIICLKRILDYVRDKHNQYDGADFTNEIAVLEWLITHPVLVYSSQPSWKPSEDEERLINTSISFLKDFADKGYENAVECIDWLKSKLNGNSGK